MQIKLDNLNLWNVSLADVEKEVTDLRFYRVVCVVTNQMFGCSNGLRSEVCVRAEQGCL